MINYGKELGAYRPMRKIIHIDADCFYASIEMRDDPRLRNEPIAVGGRSDRRGVIATCNYAARAFGVRSAMATGYALRLCPSLIVIPPTMSKYREASAHMRQIFLQFTDRIEPLSLDEAYLDVSDCTQQRGSATHIAQEIKASIHRTLGITVSAGVSVNKFIAKVASDWQKPNGLTVITPEEVDRFAANLPVSAIPGVGKVTAEKLRRQGLRTCADIRQWDVATLQQKFGSFGHTLYQRAFGQDERPVQSNRIRQSISVEQTFSEDLQQGDPCFERIAALYADLLERIDRAGARRAIRNAFIKIKFSDFSTTTVEKQGTSARISDYRYLLEEGLSRSGHPVRLLGIGVRLSVAQGEFEQLLLDIDAQSLSD